ncbi:cryptochrome/photolyase family protein [Falsihalocynthiibacter sp. SS001]|uniref:cryptochrome/photolyase family protein n=1 Tax=Falsihalocynthiibacter sp. SS001 TaxID=3349698 RepID=UPI0036D3691D
MAENTPIIIWFRRDFRLADHPAITEAVRTERPIIPVFILDQVAESYGAAPKWRLGKAISAFDARLREVGARLILRRGNALKVLHQLAKDTGAKDIWWTRAYDPEAIARDKAVKSELTERGFAPNSFSGHALFEPWTVSTKQGGYFKVYSPMWRAVKDRDVPTPDPAPTALRPPSHWPESENLSDWELDKPMNRGARILERYACVGEAAALARLDDFVEHRIDDYKARRDYPAEDGTSKLSENLAWGEIGPRSVWHAGMRAHLEGRKGAEHFLKELVWREFAYHLVSHTPRITSANWRSEWDNFPWSNEEDEAVLRWKQGRTGIPLVDAAMREMYVTGHMHNRGRMIVGSFLTKHMLKHWRIGQKWFEQCLIDWDPAANAMGWQWVAGSGPDAAPYFRIFNPETQAGKFDAEETYVQKYIAELSPHPPEEARAFFDACPRSWELSPDSAYPAPMLDLGEGRRNALAAYEQR